MRFLGLRSTRSSRRRVRGLAIAMVSRRGQVGFGSISIRGGTAQNGSSPKSSYVVPPPPPLGAGEGARPPPPPPPAPPPAPSPPRRSFLLTVAVAQRRLGAISSATISTHESFSPPSVPHDSCS